MTQAERYWCDTCQDNTLVEVSKVKKQFDVKYIRESCGRYDLRKSDASVILKSGTCSRCGNDLAGRMFAVINCEAVCQVVEDIKAFNPGVVVIKLYDKPQKKREANTSGIDVSGIEIGENRNIE